MVFELHGLKELTIRDSGVSEVPPGVNKMKNLKSLDLSKNQLKKFIVFEPNSLEELNLSQNEFHYFPEAIINLTSLEILNLSYNQIKGIPAELYRMENLKHLMLYENDFSAKDIELARRLLPKCNIHVKAPEFVEPIIH